jgi:protein required for attachment to host cells
MRPLQIVVASRAAARFFEFRPDAGGVRPTDELVNADTSHHERDLVSSRPGSMRNRAAGIPQSFDSGTPAREHTTQEFARRVAERLGRGDEAQNATPLLIVAGPEFLGAVRGHLSAPTAARVAGTLRKDFGGLAGSSLLRRLEPLARRAWTELPLN